MKKYGLHGNLQAVEGKGDSLADILVQASALVSDAKGCHLYMVSRDAQDKERVWVTEVWDSKEDHDQSLHMEGVQALIAQAMPLLAGQPEKGVVMEVLTGI
ncbi:quinol monooxygenase YgiN [Catalinimonas alkaloidigena]|uniref:putative quinol monooxygenase n=1 Tax=Catalinimonas alkaloidigena TaxID=1075417 RepID=UPI0024061537|nr:antibiotic biosynthesis monooxygenase [Catalinimonas alkaloidigena]MDF9798684.1 quinol monooxygenase YgiN [Catalinimonas alkaloidigena]